MPTALPGISLSRQRAPAGAGPYPSRSFPEVASVFGAVGRSDSATDNAPLDMYDTTVMLKPREQWPAGMTYEKLIQQMDEKLQFPGLSNTWTMPVENRLDMELTGIKTPVGMKVQGPNVDGIQQLASQIQNVLSGLPEMRSVFAEKVAQGFYVNVDVNRAEAARYGLTVADVQTAVDVRHRRPKYCGEHRRTRTLSHQRPLPERLPRQCRTDARSAHRHSIRRTNSARAGSEDFVLAWPSDDPRRRWRTDGIHLHRPRTRDYGGFVEGQTSFFTTNWRCQANYTFQWSGEYELELRAKAAAATDSASRFLCDFPAAVPGLPLGSRSACADLPDDLRHEWRIAAAVVAPLQLQRRRWVGYIALFGIAVETGVVMVVYLHEALEHKLQSGEPVDKCRCGSCSDRRSRSAFAAKADDRHAQFSPAWFRSSGNPASAPM